MRSSLRLFFRGWPVCTEIPSVRPAVKRSNANRNVPTRCRAFPWSMSLFKGLHIYAIDLEISTYVHQKEVQCFDAYLLTYLPRKKKSCGNRPGGRGWLLLVSWRYVGVEGGRSALFLLLASVPRSSRCLKRRRRCSLVVLWFTSHRRRRGKRALPSQTKSRFSEEQLNSRACSAILPGRGCHPVLLQLVLLCAPKVGIGFPLPG